MTETKTETTMTIPLPDQDLISGSDGLIFNPTITPWSCGGGYGKHGNGNIDASHYVSMIWNIYLPYKDHSKDVPYNAVCKNCHFGLVLPKHEKITS